MEPGALVWVRDAAQVWTRGSVLTNKVSQKVATIAVKVHATGSRKTVSVPLDGAAATSASGAVFEADDIKLCNPHLCGDDEVAAAAAQSNLISLMHLHEPSILHVVSVRFRSDLIYTYTGRILLAVNPFQTLPIYSDEVMSKYEAAAFADNAEAGKAEAAVPGAIPGGADEGGDDIQGLEPHVFAVAAATYRQMMEFSDTDGRPSSRAPSAGAGGSSSSDVPSVSGPNQSILVSGESGAGKTETTKFIMRFLASVGKVDLPDAVAGAGGGKSAKDPPTMDKKVMISNPILEAFGNAKTLRNDNSSRFGKFIELHFEEGGTLVGGRVHTYLLEKVRVVSQVEGERNYHAFYQLCNGATDAMRKMWAVGKPADYHYLNQSGCTTLSKVNDRDEFHKTARSMIALGFTHAEMQGACRTLAAILHLGNVKFVGEETSTLDPAATKSLSIAAKLLHVSKSKLFAVMATRRLDVAGSVVHKDQTPAQASNSRDALAKHIYGRMFNWIVVRTNEFLGCENEGSSFVGILDIFGFETFEKNSFEQLCINYTNESLQHHFNQYVFKLEQEIYESEGIVWTQVDFPDNTECLSLIEAKRPPGILSLLDQECLMPRGSDESFARKLYDGFMKSRHPRFEATAREQGFYRFTVLHYAGKVTYDTADICAKNKDAINSEATELIASSSDPVVSAYFTVKSFQDLEAEAAAAELAASRRGGSKGLSTTVASQFRTQLKSLLTAIRSTTPHFVRCLKPNSACEPRALEPESLVSQLRCGGVLEAARVSRLGYPIRMSHDEFMGRYGKMVPTSALASVTNSRDGCRKVLESVAELEDSDHQTGTSRVFLRKDGFLCLEAARQQRLGGSALAIQRVFRGHQARLRCRILRRQAIRVQAFFRMGLAKLLCIRYRKNRVTRTFQSLFRMHVQRRAYLHQRDAIITMQALLRGCAARRVAAGLRRQAAAARIQETWRMFKIRRQYLECLGMARRIQRACRAFLCRTSLARVRRRRHEEAVATKLQAVFRMYLAKVKARHLRDQAVREASAVHVQRVYRGFLGRVDARERRRGAKTLQIALWAQSMSRMFKAKQVANVLRRERLVRDSAVKIQCAVRRHQAVVFAKHLRTAESRKQGAIMIQCSYRCFKARSRLAALKLRARNAAIIVQCAYRCCMARRIHAVLYKASARFHRAVQIQCAYRCYRARVERTQLETRRDNAARTIQHKVRANHMASALHRMSTSFHRAACIIQCAFRCSIARYALKRLKRNHVEGLVSKSTSLESKVEFLEAELKASKRRLESSLEKQQEQLKQIGTMEAESFSRKNEIYRLKATVDARDRRIAQLEPVEAENASLRGKVAKLRSVLSAARDALAELPKVQEAYVTLQHQHEALKLKLEKQEASLLEVTRLQSENRVLRLECDGLCERLADVASELGRGDSLASENQRLKSQLATLIAEKKEAQRVKDAMQDPISRGFAALDLPQPKPRSTSRPLAVGDGASVSPLSSFGRVSRTPEASPNQADVESKSQGEAGDDKDHRLYSVRSRDGKDPSAELQLLFDSLPTAGEGHRTKGKASGISPGKPGAGDSGSMYLASSTAAAAAQSATAILAAALDRGTPAPPTSTLSLSLSSSSPSPSPTLSACEAQGSAPAQASLLNRPNAVNAAGLFGKSAGTSSDVGLQGKRPILSAVLYSNPPLPSGGDGSYSGDKPGLVSPRSLSDSGEVCAPSILDGTGRTMQGRQAQHEQHRQHRHHRQHGQLLDVGSSPPRVLPSESEVNPTARVLSSRRPSDVASAVGSMASGGAGGSEHGATVSVFEGSSLGNDPSQPEWQWGHEMELHQLRSDLSRASGSDPYAGCDPTGVRSLPDEREPHGADDYNDAGSSVEQDAASAPGSRLGNSGDYRQPRQSRRTGFGGWGGGLNLPEPHQVDERCEQPSHQMSRGRGAAAPRGVISQGVLVPPRLHGTPQSHAPQGDGTAMAMAMVPHSSPRHGNLEHDWQVLTPEASGASRTVTAANHAALAVSAALGSDGSSAAHGMYAYAYHKGASGKPEPVLIWMPAAPRTRDGGALVGGTAGSALASNGSGVAATVGHGTASAAANRVVSRRWLEDSGAYADAVARSEPPKPQARPVIPPGYPGSPSPGPGHVPAQAPAPAAQPSGWAARSAPGGGSSRPGSLPDQHPTLRSTDYSGEWEAVTRESARFGSQSVASSGPASPRSSRGPGRSPRRKLSRGRKLRRAGSGASRSTSASVARRRTLSPRREQRLTAPTQSSMARNAVNARLASLAQRRARNSVGGAGTGSGSRWM